MHDRYYDRKKKIQSSVWRVHDHYYDQKLLRPEKKVLVVYLAGARSLLRPEKKVLVSSVWRVRDYYYFYHGSDLHEIIRFLRKIECIEFECNKFVLVLVQIDLIHFTFNLY